MWWTASIRPRPCGWASRSNAPAATATSSIPSAQEEFYQFFALFNNVPEEGRALKFGNSPPMIKAPTQSERQKLEKLEKKAAALECEAAIHETEIAAAQEKWERSILNRPAHDWSLEEGLVARPALDESHPVAVLGDIAGFGFYDKFTFSIWVKPAGGAGTILSRMVDEPAGRGLQRRARPRQGAGKPGQALARRRDPRRDEERPAGGRLDAPRRNIRRLATGKGREYLFRRQGFPGDRPA